MQLYTTEHCIYIYIYILITLIFKILLRHELSPHLTRNTEISSFLLLSSCTNGIYICLLILHKFACLTFIEMYPIMPDAYLMDKQQGSFGASCSLSLGPVEVLVSFYHFYLV